LSLGRVLHSVHKYERTWSPAVVQYSIGLLSKGFVIKDDDVPPDLSGWQITVSRPLRIEARQAHTEKIFVHLNDSQYVSTIVGVTRASLKHPRATLSGWYYILSSSVSSIRHQENPLLFPNNPPQPIVCLTFSVRDTGKMIIVY